MLGMAMLTMVVSSTTKNAPRQRMASAPQVRRATRSAGAAMTTPLRFVCTDRVKSSAVAVPLKIIGLLLSELCPSSAGRTSGGHPFPPPNFARHRPEKAQMRLG